MSEHEHPHRPYGELKLPELPSSRIAEASLQGWEASPDPRLVAAEDVLLVLLCNLG